LRIYKCHAYAGGGGKYAIDINPDVKKYAAKSVKTIVDDVANLEKHFSKESVSIFWMGSFLEHISKDNIRDLFQMEYKLLEPGGELWILTPNIKYTGGQYWDFFDHITPLTEKALMEVGMECGYRVKKCITKFLPYTVKSRMPTASWLVKLYLKLMPLSGMVFGKGSFIILKKPVAS